MDTSYYTFESPELNYSFFTCTEDSVSSHYGSQDDGHRTPRSADWDTSSSLSGPSTPGYEDNAYSSIDMKLDQASQDPAMQALFVDPYGYSEHAFVPMEDSYAQPILRSNDLDYKSSNMPGMAAIPFAGDVSSLFLGGRVALPFHCVPHSAPVFAGSDTTPNIDYYIKSEDAPKTSSRRKSNRKSAAKSYNGGDKYEPCPYSTVENKCTYRYRRKEHLKRHKFMLHHEYCTPAELAKIRIEPCVIRLETGTGCKETAANRHDNMCQHMATHVKGARNKSFDPWFMVYKMRKQYMTTRPTEELDSGLVTAVKSIWTRAVRERAISKVERNGKPDVELMQSMSDYDEYISQVGHDVAAQRANTKVWHLLIDCTEYYCPELEIGHFRYREPIMGVDVKEKESQSPKTKIMARL